MHGIEAGKPGVGTASGLVYAAGATVILADLFLIAFCLGIPVWSVLLGRRLGALVG